MAVYHILDTRTGDVTLPIATNAGSPTNGTSGTLAGIADAGSLLIDNTNAVAYQNTGTLASPTWTALVAAPNGIVSRGVATGLTASTTHTLAGATALTKELNIVSTAANSGDAVSLPALAPGQSAVVFNSGASPIAVFPAAASVAIDGGTAGASVTLTNAKRAAFYCTAANVVVSAQLGVAAA